MMVALIRTSPRACCRLKDNVASVSCRRHDVMIVDPIQNIIIDRESGEPLMIDFGRGRRATTMARVAAWGWTRVSGETAGSIYTTRIKTFMKKVLQSCSRSGSIQHAGSATTKHEAGCWPGVFQKPATMLQGTYAFERSCSRRRTDRSCIQQHFRDERKAARYIRSLEDTLFQCYSLIC